MAVTRERFRRYVRAMNAISGRTRQAVLDLWPRLDHSSMDALREDLLRYVPPLVAKMGQVSAAVSARFYDDVRTAGRARGDYRATTSDPGLTRVERALLYATGSQMAYSDVPAMVAGAAATNVLEYGRQTIAENTAYDPFASGYRSVPSGDNPCPFCVIKSLNTWTYHMYAGERLTDEVDGDAWHDNCSCQLIPEVGDAPAWVDDGADRDWYEAGRQRAMDDAGKTMADPLTASEVMAGMRKVRAES